MSVLGAIKEIYIYPIKSLPGIKVDKCKVTIHGIAHGDNPQVIDRKWLVIDKNGKFQTQRVLPRMTLINVKLDGDTFKLTAPDMPELIVPLICNGTEKIICRVWKCQIPGLVYDAKIGEWFSKFLNKELDLVTFDESLMSETRKVSSYFPYAKEIDETIYSDCSSFMLISDSSLEDLNTRLKKKLPISNFRPNFYATNCSGPFAEDNWKNFKIADVQFNYVYYCTRCLLTTVDTVDGVKDPDMEPLKTLKSYRMLEKDQKAAFGIHCALYNNDQVNKEIAVNDRIEEF